MSQEHFPTQRDPSTGRVIPHSGEPVYREFDTPLVDAYQRGLINELPDDASTITPPEGIQKIETKKGKKGLFVKLGVGGAALAVATTGVVFGINMNKDKGETPPDTDPVATGEANPGAEDEKKEPVLSPEEQHEKLVAEHSLSYEKLKTPEALINAYYDQQNTWAHDPTNIEKCSDTIIYTDEESDHRPWTEIVKSSKCAKEANDVYIEALYGPDWETKSSSQLLSMIDSFRDEHNGNLVPRVLTQFDAVQYSVSYEMTNYEVSEESGEKMIIHSNYVKSDNLDQTNLVNTPYWSTQSIDGDTGENTLTFIHSGDNWIIDSHTSVYQ